LYTRKQMDSERVQRYQQGITKPEDLIPDPLSGMRTIDLCGTNVISEDKQTFAKNNNIKYDKYDDEDSYNTFSGYESDSTISKTKNRKKFSSRKYSTDPLSFL